VSLGARTVTLHAWSLSSIRTSTPITPVDVVHTVIAAQFCGFGSMLSVAGSLYLQHRWVKT
jgi:hypothetical protein